MDTVSLVTVLCTLVSASVAASGTTVMFEPAVIAPRGGSSGVIGGVGGDQVNWEQQMGPTFKSVELAQPLPRTCSSELCQFGIHFLDYVLKSARLLVRHPVDIRNRPLVIKPLVGVRDVVLAMLLEEEMCWLGRGCAIIFKNIWKLGGNLQYVARSQR
jgi:hypothetical protein